MLFVRAAAQQFPFQSTLWYVCVCVLVKPIFSVDVRSTPIVWCWFSRAEMDRTKLFEKKSGAADCGIQFLFFFLAAHRHERKEIPQREKLS